MRLLRALQVILFSSAFAGAQEMQDALNDPWSVSEVKAVALSGTLMELRWAAPSLDAESTEFQIERRERGGGEFKRVGTSLKPGFRDRSVLPGKTYQYRIRTPDSFGSDSFSEAASAQTPENLIVNNGFELGDLGYELPQDALLDRVNIYEGKAAARLSLSGDYGTSYIRTAPAPVLEGKWYQISSWMRTESVESFQQGAGITVSWFDAEKKFLEKEDVAMAVTGSRPWGLYSKTLQAPPRARFAGLYLSLRQAKGIAWFDQLRIFYAFPKEVRAQTSPSSEPKESLRDAVKDTPAESRP